MATPYNFHAALINTMPSKRKACIADDKISQSSPVRRKPAGAETVEITSQDIADRSVPHFRHFVNQKEPDYRIVIPSHDRSKRLCTGTLTMLRRHGIDMR